jgi:protocatechuate 3,4-dioxygenase beta subunit
MKRRKFIQDSSLLAISVGIFGKIKWDGERYIGTDPTTTDILGPFYRPGAPIKTDLVQAQTKGQILHFSGTVFGKDGKSPVNGALIEIWHCNEHGVYDNTSDDYVYRASQKTTANGKYNFKTILPVAYAVNTALTRPAHIHMRISAKGVQDLITQVYFKGDQHLNEDEGSSNPAALNRILEISSNGKQEKIVKFDIYLKEEYLLEAQAYKKITGLYEMKDKSMAEFYKDGDQLFAKVNGQIMEALDYKGDNTFQGGIGYITAKFELQKEGGAKVIVTIKENGKSHDIEGSKLLKY